MVEELLKFSPEDARCAILSVEIAIANELSL
jgi:hypothetical protein